MWTLHRTLTRGHNLPFSAVDEGALSPVENCKSVLLACLPHCPESLGNGSLG